MEVTYDLIQECLDEARLIVEDTFEDWAHPTFVSVTITHARSYWANIHRVYPNMSMYRLRVSDYFQYYKDDKKAREELFLTMVHELLHTLPGCMNHGPKFKAACAKIKRNWGYTITTTCTPSAEEYYQDKMEKREIKYTVTCENCGHIWYFKRQTISTQHPERCKCPYCSSKGQFSVASAHK